MYIGIFYSSFSLCFVTLSFFLFFFFQTRARTDSFYTHVVVCMPSPCAFPLADCSNREEEKKKEERYLFVFFF